MKLKIEVGSSIHILHTMGAFDEAVVKICLPGNPNPATLQKGEYNSSPMFAKDFLDYLEKSREGCVCIATEETTQGSSAWICACDDINSLVCTVKNQRVEAKCLMIEIDSK